MRARNLGFTLIELMVTLALLAILVMLAVPNMTTWARNAKVRSVAESLQNDIRIAQIEAIKQSRRTVFALTAATPALLATPSSTGSRWYAQTLPLTGDVLTTGALLLSSSVALQNGVGVSISAGGGFICFNSAGRLSSSTVAGLSGSCTVGSTATTPVTYSLSIVGGDRPLNVQVMAGGKVRLCDPSKPLSSSQPDGCS